VNLRISGLLTIAGFALTGFLGSAQSHAQNAYVTNSDGALVSVIDTATNTVIASIPSPVGGQPLYAAVTPDGTKVYVANSGANTVSVIATATNTVTATIPVDNSATAVAVAPDGSKVYVTGWTNPSGSRR